MKKKPLCDSVSKFLNCETLGKAKKLCETQIRKVNEEKTSE